MERTICHAPAHNTADRNKPALLGNGGKARTADLLNPEDSSLAPKPPKSGTRPARPHEFDEKADASGAA